MTRIVVPVRYPLSDTSKRTLRKSVEVANQRDAELTVLHVNLYQNGRRVTRTDLKRAVEQVVGPIDRVRYVVRSGFIVEETILEEVAAEDADAVIIGHKQAPRWRQLIAMLVEDPDIETFLKDRLNCEVITVGPEKND